MPDEFERLTTIKDQLTAPNLVGGISPKMKVAPAPFTVTEAMEALLEKQGEIKAALDVLIADATTLRSQM